MSCDLVSVTSDSECHHLEWHKKLLSKQLPHSAFPKGVLLHAGMKSAARHGSWLGPLLVRTACQLVGWHEERRQAWGCHSWRLGRSDCLLTCAPACRVLATMGVPQLRAEFLRAFGQPTASNNSAWLRRKLAETKGEDA